MADSSKVTQQVKHVLKEFQIGDLEKCKGANFLQAIGLMVATEFLGGVITGKLGLDGQSECRFEEGFKYLGAKYEDILTKNKHTVMDVYKNVRCGLVHQYLPTKTEGVFGGQNQQTGIMEVNGQFRIIPENYIRDLDAAVDRLLKELDTKPELLRLAQKALSQIPALV